MAGSAVDGLEGRDLAGRIFSGLALSYDRTLDWTTLLQDRYWKRWALERASPSRGDLVLDIGCGTCVAEEGLEGTGCEVVGLDLTEEMLRIGLGKELRSTSLLRGDAEALPFGDGLFDVVISFYVVKYCSMERFVSEARRVLKPGGRLVVYDFVRPSGSVSPLLALYIYGFLELAGRLLKRANPGVSLTFLQLPRIVRSATWNLSFSSLLESEHIRVVERAPLSSGAVEAFVGRSDAV